MNATMCNTRLWIIITDRSRPIRDVLRELTDAGLVVSHVLEAMGGITGTAEDDVVENLRKVRGVMGIRADTSVDEEAPDSSPSW